VYIELVFNIKEYINIYWNLLGIMEGDSGLLRAGRSKDREQDCLMGQSPKY
jgi:hypothetical protein